MLIFFFVLFFGFLFVGLWLMGVGGAIAFVKRSKSALRGKCPWCAALVIGHPPGFNCPACANRILARNKTFLRAPR